VVEFESVPSATTCTVTGRLARIASPYPVGIDSASEARPRSRYGSISATVVTVSTTVKFAEASNRAASSRLAGVRSPSATTTGTSRTSVVAA
jgi:hypothetical protein